MSTWYVIRVDHKDGKVGFLGLDSVGTYLPPDMRHALLFDASEREQAMNATVIKFFKERGSTVEWCRIQLIPEPESEPTPAPNVAPDA
jgi:hypothetical protein